MLSEHVRELYKNLGIPEEVIQKPYSGVMNTTLRLLKQATIWAAGFTLWSDALDVARPISEAERAARNVLRYVEERKHNEYHPALQDYGTYLISVSSALHKEPFGEELYGSELKKYGLMLSGESGALIHHVISSINSDDTPIDTQQLDTIREGLEAITHSLAKRCMFLNAHMQELDG